MECKCHNVRSQSVSAILEYCKPLYIDGKQQTNEPVNEQKKIYQTYPIQ